MNVTFLIGNGFDLGIGLKTGYKDFYNTYCTITSEDEQSVKTFKKSISGDYDTWSDFESAFGEYAFSVTDVEDYLRPFEDFVESFSIYLREEEKRFDNTKVDAITEGMKNALTSYCNLRPADVTEINALLRVNSVTFNFVSFNYTRCLDDCVEILKRKPDCNKLIHGEIGNVIHVHGYTDNGMIMGVNDISQIENDKFKENPEVTEEIVKPIQNQIFRMNFDKDATEIIKNSTIICVYGMSLGETDAKWWELLIDWLKLSKINQLILLMHRSETGYTFRWKRFLNATRNMLFMYSNITREEQKELSNRIHIDTDRNIFAMDLRKAPTETGVVCESLL